MEIRNEITRKIFFYSIHFNLIDYSQIPNIYLVGSSNKYLSQIGKKTNVDVVDVVVLNEILNFVPARVF